MSGESASVSAVARTLVAQLLKTVVNDEIWAQGDDVAERWHAMMVRPVPKVIKYAKALQRILGHPASLYTVAEYKDVTIFVDEQFATVVRSPLEADDWRAIHAVNRLVACAMCYDIDRTPSRDEIHANIQATKTTKKSIDDVGTVTHACRMTYVAIGDHLDAKAAYEISARYATNDDDQVITKDWSDMLQAWPSFVDDCTKRNTPPVEAWKAIPESARPSLVKALYSPNAALWSQIDQMNNYTKISTNIPSGVMNRIETMASKLAQDLQTGTATMENLNLQSIGESVLANCDPEELSKLTGNIGELLPMLSQMGGGFPTAKQSQSPL